MTSPNAQREAILRRLAALPDGLWRRCGVCGVVAHRDDVARRHGICPECAHHHRLSARERIDGLVDAGTFVEHYRDLVPTDPLGFVDRVGYPERLARAQAATGLADAAVAGVAEVAGRPVSLAVLDFAFMGGSMGSVVGEKVARAADLARGAGLPFVTVACSGGARMQEGVLSLLQMAKTAAAIRRLRDAGGLHVSVLADPVYGGVAASFASLGDVIIAERGARAGFAGRAVIAQTIGEELPPGFQTAEFLREHGHVDLVVERGEVGGVVARLAAVHAARGASCRRPLAAPAPATAAAAPVPPLSEPVDAWDAVRRAREPGRPTALDYLQRLVTGFVPLHGDRWSEDDPAVVGGLGLLGGRPVVVVAHCKGRDTRDNVRRNFGMPHPSGYRKAMRLLGLAERLGVPVVALVDTPGAYPGVRAEEGNQSGAIAEALALAAGLRVPIVGAVTGEGGSGGALALAVGDRLLMQERAVMSVISPEGCATILFGDAARAAEAARALRPAAADLVALGVADEVVAEPPGGAAADHDAAAALLGEALGRCLDDLAGLDVRSLLVRRQRRLAAYGAFGRRELVIDDLEQEDVRV